MLSFEPTHDWVVLELPEENKNEEVVHSSGLFIPTDANIDEDFVLPEGKVVSVGPGYTDPNGKHVDVPINIGDTVKYMPNGGIEHNENGIKYYFVNYRNSIIAISRGENNV